MGAAGLVAALAGRPASRWYALGWPRRSRSRSTRARPASPAGSSRSPPSSALLALAPPLRGAGSRARTARRRSPRPPRVTLAATLGTAPLIALHFEPRLAGLAAGEPARRAGGRADHVARHAGGGRRRRSRRRSRAPLNALAAPAARVTSAWVAHAAAAAPLARCRSRLGGPVGSAARRARRGRVARPPRLAAARGAGAAPPPGRARGARSPGGRGAPSPRWPARSRRCSRGARRRAARPAAPGELVVSFLDVGQGDATLLQRDGARDPRRHRAARRPDPRPPAPRPACAGSTCSSLTHAQADHEGAALAVIARASGRGSCSTAAPAGRPAVERSLPAGRERRRRAASMPAGRAVAERGRAAAAASCGRRRARPAFQPDGDPNAARDRRARRAIGAFDLLLTADAESDVTGPLALPAVDVLKVAHHGSADPGLPALLARLHAAGGGDRGRSPQHATATRRRPRWPRCARCRRSCGPIATARCACTSAAGRCAWSGADHERAGGDGTGH